MQKKIFSCSLGSLNLVARETFGSPLSVCWGCVAATAVSKDVYLSLQSGPSLKIVIFMRFCMVNRQDLSIQLICHTKPYSNRNFQNDSSSRYFLPRVPEAFFSVSWERKKTSGNGGQLTDRAAPIGFK